MTEVMNLQDISAIERTSPRIGQLLLGPTDRCNLACDYCHITAGVNKDVLKLEQPPKIMPMNVVAAAGHRLAEELQRDGEKPPPSFGVVMQRGEPAIAPPAFFDEAVPLLRKTVGPRTWLDISMQTNASLLTDKFLAMVRRQRISLGISLDGPEYVNDLHRRTHSGESSYAKTMQGIGRVVDDGRYVGLFTGFLSVIPSAKDLPNIDPLEVYRYLKQFEPPSLDFLLPHMRRDLMQVGMRTQEERDLTPYANWLAPIFDEWFKKDISTVRIRTFDSILQMLRGDQSGVESIGESDPTQPILLAVNPSGGYEMVDTLSMIPGQVAKIGLNVINHSFEQASAAITRKAQRLGMLSLAPMCQGCPHRKECGGGYVTHRYSHENLFNNPSAYCSDLAALISHIKGTVAGVAYTRALQRQYDRYKESFVAMG